jgi:tetratricopeptide (TPR) repeat protein
VAAPSPALAEARRLADARQFDAAAATLREHLERVPSDDAARSLLARVLAWGKHYDASIAEYERLLAEHPDRASDRAGYARVLAWSGRTEQALAEFRQAVAADSSDVETRIAYARALSWTGDFSGASIEYRRILDAHPASGEAWLGYATLARWRAGATASDRFLSQAEALGAGREAADEERAAVRHALAPSFGGGWSRSRERQYVTGPDFTLTTSGPYTSARMTVGRTVDLSVRASWGDQSERSEGGTLAYDVDMTALRADVALLRGYPFQAAAGLEARHVSAGVAGVTHPLLDPGTFAGWSLRSWGFLGRFTPAVGIRREFLPIKSSAPVAELLLGHQTVLDGTLAWQWSGRGSASATIERGDYSDGNARTALQATTRYRVRTRQPVVALDYAFGYTDFDTTSSSYFTPLASMRHTVGIGADGYASRYGLGYGARYQFSAIGSDNFEAIRIHTWSAHVNAASLGAVGLGVDGAYARDNNAYEIWSIGIHAAARW